MVLVLTFRAFFRGLPVSVYTSSATANGSLVPPLSAASSPSARIRATETFNVVILGTDPEPLPLQHEGLLQVVLSPATSDGTNLRCSSTERKRRKVSSQVQVVCAKRYYWFYQKEVISKRSPRWWGRGGGRGGRAREDTNHPLS